MHYKVLVPKSGDLAFLQRYPWLGRDLDQVKSPKSWEFSFSATGVPLAAKPSERSLTNPVVTWVKSSTIDHANLTVERITGTGDAATLTPSGSRYVQLITDAF